MLPAIFGSSVSQVALLLDTLIASFLATGSIAWLYYADRLMEFPLGVFSIALATVILPGLAAHHAAQSPERFNATLDWAVKLTVIVVLPATVALVDARRAAHGHDLPLRKIQRARRADGVAGADGLRLGAPRVQHGEGARAGLLRAAGHAHADADRHPGARPEHGPEPRHRAAARPHQRPAGPARAARAQQRHRRLVQLDDAVSRPAARGSAAARAGMEADARPGRSPRTS